MAGNIITLSFYILSILLLSQSRTLLSGFFFWTGFIIKNQEVQHMAVFRIEKNSDFTIMPNYPFRDMRLSFKGRGLLGTMLTLRDDWDYTLAGLTAISPHGKSYVSTGLN